MKHLDEGTLQAWLDMPRSGLGVSEVADIERHLAGCETCAAELEALRGSDERAHALLVGGLDRDVERPPFEDVVARARGRDDARRGLRRLNRMAWAASIVVAIGVGWMTNELYRDGPPSPTSRVPVAPAAEPEAERADDAQARPSVADVADAEPAPPPPSVVADADAAAPRSNDVVGAPGAGAGGAAPSAPAPAPDAPVAERFSRQGGAADSVERDALADAPAGGDLRAYQDSARAVRTTVTGVVRDERGEPMPSVQVYVEDLGIGMLTREDGSYSLLLSESDSPRLDVVAQRIGYRTETREVVATGGDAVVADFSLEEEALQLQEVIVTGTVGQSQRRAIGNTVQRLSAVPLFAWETETPEGAEAALGRSPLMVADLRVVSVEAAETDDAEPIPVVRIRQALGDDGTILTLIQGDADDAREAWQIPAEGAVESRRTGGLLVTGTAPVAVDSLRVLLGALR
jgi:hypothetical protein